MIRRNGTALVVSAVVLVGVTWFAVAQAADQNPAGAVGGAQGLLDRIAKLEARVAQLERAAGAGIYTGSLVPAPRAMLPGAVPPAPRGAIPHEFNGMRYYILPLDKSPSP